MTRAKYLAGLCANGRQAPRERSEFAVLIFPFRFGRDRLDRVPMLGDLAVLNPEQVVKRRRLTSETALADREVSLPI